MRSTSNAKRYNSVKIRLKLFDLLFVVLYLAFFQAFLSDSLKALVFSFTHNFYFALGFYLIIFCLFYYIADFPLQFYSAFIVEHKFKLSNEHFLGWFADDVKKGLLSLGIFIIFLEALYVFLRFFTATWWLWIAFFWFVGTITLAKISPSFIIPLFFKYSEVPPGLKEKITELCKICKIKLLGVYKINFSKKTAKLNAAVTGFGKTRRVILADNLIREFTDEEIRGVLAHEFGHHKLFHMWKLLVFGFVSTFFSFFLLYLASSRITLFLKGEAIYDIKMFPAFSLVLFLAGFLTLPFMNGFSRKLEREADIFALRATENKSAFISLMEKLAAKNLADPNPAKIIKFLFYDHPPISERIKLAEKGDVPL